MNRADRRAFAKENGVPMPPPEPNTAQLALGPVPVSTVTGTAETADGYRVILQCQTPLGVQVYFLNADHARQLASELAALASTAASGLVIAKDIPGAP